MYRIRVGTQYLGGLPLYKLTPDVAWAMKFVTPESAQVAIDVAREKHPAQDLSGYVLEPVGG